MFFPLFLLFVVVPVAEIYVLVSVGSVLGAFNTIALVLLTALLGASLVRSQGLATLMDVQQRLSRGEMPGQQIIEAMLLALAGVLLVTPGFVTDFFGLLILTPVTRAPIARYVMTHMQVRMVARGAGGFEPRRPGDAQSGNTIEGDFERKD
ncbi:FxsA family protein [Ferrimonas gelatinilytica]|uniref:FxsA family protein n=1 Tax=Ferrimonas gelatinilytica TaxID=1255257 RepID=A0ABP9S7N5_9GAMM